LPEYFAGIEDQLKSLKMASFPTSLPIAIGTPFTIHLGGGTDLYVQKHEEMTHADIDFVFDRPELNDIKLENNKCIIGASATVSDLRHSSIIREIFPQFQSYSKLISSTPIRNMATVAGNFINASPIGDLTIFFLALDAQVNLSGGKEGRTVPLRKLYKGYKQLDKDPVEFIENIWFELPGKHSHFHFEKVSKRTHLDIASVNSAILLTKKNNVIENAGIAAGGVGPIPMFLEKTSTFLKGKKISEELVRQAIEVMKTEIAPISDARGTKEYKTLLLGQLIKAHFMQVFPELAADKMLK
jgi:xanthine dehydrogenase small subunit